MRIRTSLGAQSLWPPSQQKYFGRQVAENFTGGMLGKQNRSTIKNLICMYVPIQSAEAEALISMHTDFRSVFVLLQPFVRQPLFASCPVKSMDKYSAAKFYSPTEGNQSTYTGSIPDLLGKNKR